MVEPREEQVKQRLRWIDVKFITKHFSTKLKGENIKNIYGIPRGGLVVAVLMSHLLDLPVITRKDLITKDTLLVDDIIDSGDSIMELVGYLNEKKINGNLVFSLYKRYNTKYTGQSLSVELKNDNWIIFPWEAS